MILNLLRVESIRVEDMMKSSFKEVISQSKVPQHEDTLKAKQALLSSLQDVGEHLNILSKFYKCGVEYLQLREQAMV